MLEVVSSDPRYSFKKPPEWDELVTCAEAAIIPGQPKSQQEAAVEALWSVLPDIDVESQEVNRYYGLGLVICKFAKGSFLPADAPGSIIPSAAYSIVRSYLNTEQAPQGLRPRDLSTNYIGTGFEPGSPEYHEYSLAERLTIDTLQAHTITKDEWDKTPAHMKEYYRTTILHGDRAFTAVRRNTFGAAFALFKTAVHKLVEQKTGKAIDYEAFSGNFLKDMVTEEEIRTLIPPATFAQAAQLRQDEFRHQISDFIYIGADGTAEFDRAAMPETPRVPVTEDYMPPRHHNRIKCPALFVGGAIAYAANATPEIVLRAQHRVLNQAQ